MAERSKAQVQLRLSEFQQAQEEEFEAEADDIQAWFGSPMEMTCYAYTERRRQINDEYKREKATTDLLLAKIEEAREALRERAELWIAGKMLDRQYQEQRDLALSVEESIDPWDDEFDTEAECPSPAHVRDERR